MRVAGLVEETFEVDSIERRQPTERCTRGRQIFDELLRRAPIDAVLPCDPRSATASTSAPTGGGRQRTVDALPQGRHARRQLVAAPGRLAEPERYRRRQALRILDQHLSRRDLQYPVRGIAELKNVAGQTLGRKVLVDAADRKLFRAAGRRRSRTGPVSPRAFVIDVSRAPLRPRSTPLTAVVVNVCATPAHGGS